MIKDGILSPYQWEAKSQLKVLTMMESTVGEFKKTFFSRF
jgi:hypothetical protein